VRRDVGCLAVLLLVALAPVLRDVEQASRPGLFARIVINRGTVNRGAFLDGTLPLWNPYEFGGRPHLADPETLALYPPHVVLRALPLPLFFALSFALHTWLAGAGTYVAARVLGASRLISVLAAGAMMGGRLLLPFDARARSLDVYAVAWLPLIAALSLRSAGSKRWLPHPGLVVAASFGLLAAALNPTYVLATVVISYLLSAIWFARDAGRRHLLAQPIVLGVLVIGLIAVQLLPTARFAATARGREAVVHGEPSPSPDEIAGRPNPELVSTLRALAGSGRVLSTCPRTIDDSRWVALGLPGIGGAGGAYAADYGRFTQTVRGPTEKTRPSFEGIPEASSGVARADLMNLLGVEYLVDCGAPDSQRWSLIGAHDDVGIYRRTVPARAFWTCAPLPAGRAEIEYRLRNSSYDDNLILRPHLIVNIRWPAGLSDADRARAESALKLVPHRDIADRTWEYNLLDRSRENVEAIVHHPLVEDTQGIDRANMVVTHAPAAARTFDEPKSELIIGADECRSPVTAAVQAADRFDGGMIVDVDAPHDGIVFFSETYYRDRRAWVDGRRAGRLKVNLAFTGVPVSAGRHRIELKFDTRSFWWGAGLSALTLLIWLAAERRSRAPRNWLIGSTERSIPFEPEPSGSWRLPG